MTDIQLIAIDLDGTLLDSQRQLSEVNAQALQAAADAGVRVVICTGRTLPSIQFLLDRLPQTTQEEYLILQNGAVIHQLPTMDVVHETTHSPADRQAVWEAFQAARDRRVQLAAFDRDHFYLVGEETPNPTMVADAKVLSTPITPIDYEALLAVPSVYKLVAFGEPEGIDATLAKLASTLYDDVHVVRSLPITIEFLPKLANKANGLKALISQLGIDPAAVMAIGDELNDVEMLELVGTAVAMGNAHAQVKQVADYITLTNNDNGVAHAIERFVTQRSQFS